MEYTIKKYEEEEKAKSKSEEHTSAKSEQNITNTVADAS